MRGSECFFSNYLKCTSFFLQDIEAKFDRIILIESSMNDIVLGEDFWPPVVATVDLNVFLCNQLSISPKKPKTTISKQLPAPFS